MKKYTNYKLHDKIGYNLLQMMCRRIDTYLKENVHLYVSCMQEEEDEIIYINVHFTIYSKLLKTIKVRHSIGTFAAFTDIAYAIQIVNPYIIVCKEKSYFGCTWNYEFDIYSVDCVGYLKTISFESDKSEIIFVNMGNFIMADTQAFDLYFNFVTYPKKQLIL